MISLLAICLIPVFFVCLLTLALGLLAQLADLRRALRRRRERRAIERAIAEHVRAMQEQVRELGRIASAAQVVHANWVFAAHRELRRGVEARA